ncbi:DUF4330 family protein [Halococcus agarilyticus]|uniref:DUF4330 family protein n=1 Tax=Halococcus agarilyticus TaxID=1232219 RepID=UPI0006775A29|nr:DUF4330 family protein [Halococcus agarilyticus]
MKGIDENGRLFGTVNVIDAVGIVLLIALIVSAGAVFVSVSSTDGGAETSGTASEDATGTVSGNATETGGSNANRSSIVVRFQLLDDAPYIVEAIDEGPVPGNENITAVLGTSRTTPVETGPNTTSNASLRLRLDVTEQQGRVQFEGERLYIGKEVQLDLGDVIVNAIVTDFRTSRTTTTNARTRT